MVRIQGTQLLPNGRLGGFTTVRASDCVDVTGGDEDEGSPEQAVDEMEKRIEEADRVMEHWPVRRGELIGERAILLVQKGLRTEIIVQYKDDHNLHVIRSAPLLHALAYDKLLQGGYRIGADGYLVAQGE